MKGTNKFINVSGLTEAESVALEHWLWMCRQNPALSRRSSKNSAKGENRTNRKIYRLIGCQPPSQWRGPDGIIMELAKVWNTLGKE